MDSVSLTLKTVLYADRDALNEALKRPGQSHRETVRATARKVLQDVAARGDEAVRAYAERWDGGAPEHLLVSDTAWRAAGESLSDDLKAALHTAYNHIRRFHEAGFPADGQLETTPGVVCGWTWRPVPSVGLYVPGGSAPLFSTALMLGVPAQLAGCSSVTLCSPPPVHPAILYAADLCGIHRVYQAGGAQAIAAMTYGTESLPPADKIFGPGNAYVYAAKALAAEQQVAIDMPAGPSEVMVVADANTPSAFIAADLLAQAEHSPDAQVLLVTDSSALAEQVIPELRKQLSCLPRASIARQALQHSALIICPDTQAMLKVVNRYAPEHLIVQIDEADAFVQQVSNAGSVFIGPWTPESAGDYASGTNHTLPTAGFARAYSGLSVTDFIKRITWQRITRTGLHNLGPTIMTMARAEQLEAHAAAVEIRLQHKEGNDANR
ncbi:MAG: histidinol dehydrogenase [Calditrichaeota bacterium]|nr:MAG: histidinol dehydrogenase [Calditrichota bacterium]